MRKKDRTEEAHDFSGLPAPKLVTPADIQAKEFGVSRFGGYKMRDVDEFLDELTATMTRLTEENERLRAGTGVPPATIGAPDLADTARQADEIIERARAEAARIVQDAQDQAGAPAGGAAMGAGDRAAVASFLAREREFLQSLATLVQGHAETIKGMAKAARPAADAPAAAASPAPGQERPATPAVAEPDRRAEGTPATPAASDARDEPLRVEEPAPATVARADDGEDAEPSQAEGDRSLRELFWGEE